MTVLLVTVVLIGVVFAVDVSTPLGLIPSLLYMVPIAVSYYLPGNQSPQWVAGICSAFTVAGFWLSPPGLPLLFSGINRAIEVVIFLASGLVLTRHRDISRELEANRRDLEERVALRTAALQASEGRLRQQAHELARSNADLEQFAYVASHDLQEPLRATAGCVQILRRRLEDKLDEEGRQLIMLAVDGANRMQTLINDLLMLSRVGRSVGHVQSTDVGVVVKEVLQDLQPVIDDQEAHVTIGDLPTVSADRTQIRQVFQNLIGNALKFRGEAPPVIAIASETREADWRFTVRDNGIGIAPQYFDRIFRIFQRLHTRRSYPGTGIGLAICQKIVERHGGEIGVESEPGRGSTFWFTLPFDSPLSGEPTHERTDAG